MKELVYKLEDVSPTYAALSPEQKLEYRFALHNQRVAVGLPKPSRWQRFKGWVADLWAKVWG